MTKNKLQLNGSKTEAMLVGTHHKLSKTDVETIKLGEISIPLVPSVKNLGVSLDNNLSIALLCKLYYSILLLSFTPD